MTKYFIIFIFFVSILENSFSQATHNFENNLIASNIRNDTINFENNKNRIFVLISDLSCSACLKDSAEKLRNVKSGLADNSCEFIVILQGGHSNVLSNRFSINNRAEIFEDYDHYLFDFKLGNGTILDISKYKQGDFPVIIIAPESSDLIYAFNYSELNTTDIIDLLTKESAVDKNK